MFSCKISICIPAYKRISYLKRLLESIEVQTYKDFEVVVTDDSPQNDVRQLCESYRAKFRLVFSKNEQVLNTPENWNEAIRKAGGEWIKLMHDDDWFSGPESLQGFAEAIGRNPEASFFFSAYTNVYEENGQQKPVALSSFWEKALRKNSSVLIADNVIGPPSVTLHRNDRRIWYDRNMKYVVDIDFYIRYLQNADPVYVNEPLVNVGINSAQVTKYTFNVPEVHLKESLYLLQKTGAGSLRNIVVFDGWWRLIRNFHIRSLADIRSTGYVGRVPSILQSMMQFQKNLPAKLLKNGVFSKFWMMVCFVLNKRKIENT